MLLEHYAHWFFFAKKDGDLQLRYRAKPSIKLSTKIIDITPQADANDVAEKIIEVINKRLQDEK